MSFTIKTVSKGSSNKHETLPHKGAHKPSQQQQEGNHPIPFLDKISVTLTVPTKEEGCEMWKAHSDAEKDTTTFFQAPKAKGYNRSYRLALPSVLDGKKWPHYQVRGGAGCMTHLRIEFVPVDLGFTGLEDLHAVLSALMNGGWSYMIKHGRITRLDVSVDFPTATMDEFHFLPAQGATTTKWARSGNLQSFQQGQPNGNCTMIYDRGAKRKAKGKSWQNKVGVRVERRLRNLAIGLNQLPALKNPFSGMEMVKRIVGPPPGEMKQPYIWALFLDAAETTGLPAALAKLPVKKRTDYRAHCKKHCVDWWGPEALWAGWQPMLKELKIADPKAWS